MNLDKVRSLCDEMAKLTPYSFAADEEVHKDYRGEYWEVTVNPPSKRLLTFGEMDGRLWVNGNLPLHESTYYPADATRFHITVAADRPIDKVAKNIVKRLVIPWMSTYTRGEEEIAALKEEARLTLEFQREMANRFELLHHTTNPNRFTYRGPIEVDVELKRPEGDYATYISIRQSLDKETFCRFMALLHQHFPQPRCKVCDATLGWADQCTKDSTHGR